MSDEPTSHPVSRRDAAALVGLLAVLDGLRMAGDLSGPAETALGDRLGHDLGTERVALGEALAALNHRLRVALGESDD